MGRSFGYFMREVPPIGINIVLEAHRKVEHRGLEPTYYELKKTYNQENSKQ
jgi:hypothetical protein